MAQQVEEWKIRNLVRKLERASGSGTSMISLVLPPRYQLARANAMLTEEYGAAANIKCRVNRLSVLTAINSVQQRLKLYRAVPANGLVVYCGTIATDDGKERRVNIDFEPFRPLNRYLYLCDDRFHAKPLRDLFGIDARYAFVVMDGSEFFLGALVGNVREAVTRFTVNLPKKHQKGGQSAARFGRLRLERRHNYVRKASETCTQRLIDSSTNQCTIAGLVLAGPADFKRDLADALDPRLSAIVLKIVDVAYGGARGFDEAIGACASILANVRFVQEKAVLAQFFEAIARDTGRVCYGARDTMHALDLGAAETVIAWDELAETFRQHADNDACENDEPTLVEWLANHHSRFGAALELVTNRSPEGSQFCRGFGGIGALLRYPVDFFDDDDDDNDADIEPGDNGAT